MGEGYEGHNWSCRNDRAIALMNVDRITEDRSLPREREFTHTVGALVPRAKCVDLRQYALRQFSSVSSKGN